MFFLLVLIKPTFNREYILIICPVGANLALTLPMQNKMLDNNVSCTFIHPVNVIHLCLHNCYMFVLLG